MSLPERIGIATRGSALALVQANWVKTRCEALFPDRRFELVILTTTGDKLQAFAPETPLPPNSKGLFTKELETALLEGGASVAVHSLKDLPTELPEGLMLAAVSPRADVRDVLIYRSAEAAQALGGRGYAAGSTAKDLCADAVIATSSTRRAAQIRLIHPGTRCVPIRGNVGTRLQKLLRQTELDGMVLACAGIARLGMVITPDGRLTGDSVPDGLLASVLPMNEMLPCVGQAAIGLQTRTGDGVALEICRALNDSETEACVTAERAFLAAMGGGCLSPVAASGVLRDGQLCLHAASFTGPSPVRGEISGLPADALDLGRTLAARLKA